MSGLKLWDGISWVDAHRTRIHQPEHMTVVMGASATDIAVATGVVTFRMPYDFTLTEVRGSVVTAPVGSGIIVDVNESGTSVLSTKLTIDAGDTSSITATTPAVISDADIADDAEITFDIDQIGSTTAGQDLYVSLIGRSDVDTTSGELKQKVALVVPAWLFGADIEAKAGVETFRMPYGFELSEVRASVSTAPTGSGITVDINANGTSILSTALTIDATEKTSTTAATPVVISTTTLAADDEITIDIDAIGSTVAGQGLMVYLIGTMATDRVGYCSVWEEDIVINVSEDDNDLSTGTGLREFDMPYGFYLTGVSASVTTAPTGSALTVDVNVDASSVLSTKLTIDAGEKTSVTAATPAVISTPGIADGATVSIDIDAVGSTVAGKELKVTLKGYRE